MTHPRDAEGRFVGRTAPALLPPLVIFPSVGSELHLHGSAAMRRTCASRTLCVFEFEVEITPLCDECANETDDD